MGLSSRQGLSSLEMWSPSDLRWIEAGGQGVVHSYSVMRRVETPYVLAYVRLDEGVVLLSNIVDCDVDDVAIGQRVSVVFRPAPEGRPVPFFRPAR